MQAAVKTVAKAGMIATMKRTYNLIKGIRSVSVAVTYEDPDNKNELKTKEFIMDTQQIKATTNVISTKMKEFVTRGTKKGNTTMTQIQTQWKIIWLNEEGEEQTLYCSTEEERNAQIQALADNGYSPVYREIQ